MTTYYVSVHDLLLRVQEVQVHGDHESLDHDISIEQDYTYHQRDTRRDLAHSSPINIQLEQKTGHKGQALVALDQPGETMGLCSKR